MGYEGEYRRPGREYRGGRDGQDEYRGGTYGYGSGGYGRPANGPGGYDRPRARWADDDRGYDRPRARWAGDDRGYDRDDDRGFFERAGDEVRSWFGDEEAERRRRQDELYDERHDRERGYRRPSSGFGGGGSYASRDRSQHHDPSYRSWRDRQMESFDRDYDEYRRENQGRFDSEFGSWRQNRQGQRDSLQRVREHMEVVGSDGAHVGTVDHIRGDRILLAKTDKDAGGHHHSIPSSWIREVGDKVEIAKTAEEAHRSWRDEEQNQGLFGNDRDRGNDRDEFRSDHNLNRSFRGTY